MKRTSSANSPKTHSKEAKGKALEGGAAGQGGLPPEKRKREEVEEVDGRCVPLAPQFPVQLGTAGEPAFARPPSSHTAHRSSCSRVPTPPPPPGDERNCWGSLPRVPINMGITTMWVPFVRRTGIGVYSSFDKTSAGISELPARSPRGRCATVLAASGAREGQRPGVAQRDRCRTGGSDAPRATVSVDSTGRLRCVPPNARPRPVRWSPWNDQLVWGISIGGAFVVKRFLGGGTYGRVYEVELDTPSFPNYHKKKYAIKFYSMCSTDAAYVPTSSGDLGEMGERSFHREAEILSAIHDRNFSAHRVMCPSVVEVFGAFAYMVDPVNHQESFYPALVMELATEGSVSSVIKRIAKDPAADPVSVMRFLGSMSAKMARALMDLHENDYYQQDVKPSNFLCFRDLESGEWRVKLGDMGLACSMNEPIPHFKCQPIGTPMYVAPELVDMKEHNQLWLNDREKVRSSETYSLACSIRDMLWTSRRVLNLEARAGGCWAEEVDEGGAGGQPPQRLRAGSGSTGDAAAAAAAMAEDAAVAVGCCLCRNGLGANVDKFLDRERFVRSSVDAFSMAFARYFKLLLARALRKKLGAPPNAEVNVNGVYAKVRDLDRLLTQTIAAKEWRKRPKLADILAAAAAVAKIV